MSDYKVSFFKKGEEKDEYLGTIYLDDMGVSRDFTIVAKAFRQASPQMFLADKTVTERV